MSIGGHPQEEAAQRLQAGLAERVARDIEVTIEGTPVAVDPAAAGFSVDYDASVAEAGGERSWDPVRLWNYFTGGDTFEAVTTVDEAAFAAYLAGLDEQHGATARDGAVTFDGGDIVTTKAREGKALDPTRPGLRSRRPSSTRTRRRSRWRTPPSCRTSTPPTSGRRSTPSPRPPSPRR